MFRRLGLIGCGLMGGSFALAIKQARLADEIVGFAMPAASAQRALELGVLDRVAASAAGAVADADLVLLAVPVAATESCLRAIRDHLAPDVLLMDVGSTKRDVIDAARRVLKGKVGTLVPAHPNTGKELAGVEHADALLYRGCQVALTPIEQTRPELLARATELWTTLGAQVRTMTPEAHDAAFAAVSHLPHLLAFAYFAGVLQQRDAEQFLALAGPGFRDFTRIAASDPAIWRDILIANREEVLKQSERFRGALGVLEQSLRECHGEALEALVSGVSQARSHWRLSSRREG